LKVALTTDTSKSVRLPGVADPKIVTRPEYEGLIREKVDATVTELADTIEDAGLGPHELAAVYRIGGAARTPLVGDALQRLQPDMDIKTEDHPKLVVAQGATITSQQHTKAAELSKAPPPPPAAPVDRPAEAAQQSPSKARAFHDILEELTTSHRAEGASSPRRRAFPLMLRAGHGLTAEDIRNVTFA